MKKDDGLPRRLFFTFLQERLEFPALSGESVRIHCSSGKMRPSAAAVASGISGNHASGLTAVHKHVI